VRDRDTGDLERFGNMPQTKVWNSSPADLDRLMERALRRGRELTEADLLKAQGTSPRRL
jgi:hypothetical protein